MEDGSRSNIPGIPSYVASFSSFSLRAELERPWSGDAPADARALFAAIRGGRVYTVIDGIARNGLLDFHAETASGQRIPMGSELPSGTAATLVARALMPGSAQIVLLRDGQEIASATGDISQPLSNADGVYGSRFACLMRRGCPSRGWSVTPSTSRARGQHRRHLSRWASDPTSPSRSGVSRKIRGRAPSCEPGRAGQRSSTRCGRVIGTINM